MLPLYMEYNIGRNSARCTLIVDESLPGIRMSPAWL
jgi:hypothetical protein